MEIKIGTKQMLKILLIISWAIFVGVSIEAGAFIANALFTLLLHPTAAKHLWQVVDLSNLHKFDSGYFYVEMILMSIVAVLKALLFYLIVRILHEKKLNIAQPFSTEVGRFVFSVSYLALGIGLFCWWGAKYTGWFVKQGIQMPDIQSLRFDGADVWLFMGVTLYVIAQVFKRGIEIQSENELTV